MILFKIPKSPFEFQLNRKTHLIRMHFLDTNNFWYFYKQDIKLIYDQLKQDLDQDKMWWVLTSDEVNFTKFGVCFHYTLVYYKYEDIKLCLQVLSSLILEEDSKHFLTA